MRQLVVATLVVAFVGLSGMLQAEEKANPTGTWKWTVTRGDQKFDMTLKLKLDGKKLTGAMVRNDQETPIQDGAFKAGQVSFKVVREREGRKMDARYTGKVTEDTIKGKVEFEREGQTQSRDWEAKREKK